MIMTDKEKMVLTPTYYVFKMYVPFQDATLVPVTFDAGAYTQENVSLPRLDAIEAKLAGVTDRSAGGQTLTAPKVDSVNTFDAPNTVAPKPISAKIQDGKLN